MSHRRRPKKSVNVELTFSDGSTKQYSFHGKSASGKSLKVTDETGKTLYIRLSRLQSYVIL